MAAFDFPSSPTTGQVFTQNGVSFVWNGYAWVGNAQQAGPQTEQFFNLAAGATNLDIAVPSWAKSAHIEGSFIANGAGSSQVQMQVSVDGTTFLTGANYETVGPYHYSGTPTAIANVALVTSAVMQFSLVANDQATPLDFTFDMNLVRAATWVYLGTARGYAKIVNTTAGALFNTAWLYNRVAAAATTALAIKALRFPFSLGFAAGSWLRVKWIGDSAAIPMGNAIADAPQDGGEYVRVNGIWRLKAQTFVLDGLTQLDVDVPATAKALRLDGVIWWAAISANNAVTWRASVDGSTFLQGASDYFYGGFIHYAGSAGYANLTPTNEAYGRLTFPFDTTTQPARIRWLMPVVKSTNTNALHAGTVNAGYYNTPTSNTYTDAQFSAGVQSGANLAIKKLRFFNGPVGGAFGNGSSIICDWVY